MKVPVFPKMVKGALINLVHVIRKDETTGISYRMALLL
jgi:hypothetical protein